MNHWILTQLTTFLSLSLLLGRGWECFHSDFHITSSNARELFCDAVEERCGAKAVLLVLLIVQWHSVDAVGILSHLLTSFVTSMDLWLQLIGASDNPVDYIRSLLVFASSTSNFFMSRLPWSLEEFNWLRVVFKTVHGYSFWHMEIAQNSESLACLQWRLFCSTVIVTSASQSCYPLDVLGMNQIVVPASFKLQEMYIKFSKFLKHLFLSGRTLLLSPVFHSGWHQVVECRTYWQFFQSIPNVW